MHFIPVNNNLDKALAFAPSLDPQWRKSQIFYPENKDIETIDMIEDLMKEGWHLDGVIEDASRKGLVNSHRVKLSHKDIRTDSFMNNSNNEMFPNAYLKNDIIKPTSGIETKLGIYRLVCSNGLIRFDSRFEENISQNNYNEGITNIKVGAEDILNGYLDLRFTELNPDQVRRIAETGLRLRFGQHYERDLGLHYADALKVVREEDKGNSVYSVYNRVQENCVKHGMLNPNLGGIMKTDDLMRFNTGLDHFVFSKGYEKPELEWN